MTMAPAKSASGNLPAVVTRDATPIEILERVIVTGDLGQLTPTERVALYARTCESLGLNPLTRPFEYITLNSKLTLYVRKDATDQLRRINRVSIDSLRREPDPDAGLLTYIADGHTPDGRRDQASGTVSVKGLSGEALANASMKAETKSKRRLTLSLVGLGFLDESEIEGAERVDVDPATGEVREAAKPRSLLEAVQVQQARLEAPAPAAPTASQTVQNAPAAANGADVQPSLELPAAAAEPLPGEIVEMSLADFTARVNHEHLTQSVAPARKRLFGAERAQTDLAPGELGRLYAEIRRPTPAFDRQA